LAESLKARFVATSSDDHYLGEQYPVIRDLIVEIANTPVVYEPGEGLKNDFE
jgi:hypothetical protein